MRDIRGYTGVLDFTEEIASLEKHGVLKLVPFATIPVGDKVVSTKWVLKIKAKCTYKGRLVVPGFSQNPGSYTPGVGTELSLNQPKKKLLNEDLKRRYLAITGAMMYLAQVIRYYILYAVNQLARVNLSLQKLTWGRSALLLGRVHRLLRNLQAGRLPACCLLRC